MKIKSIIALLFAAYAGALAANNLPATAKDMSVLLAHVQSDALAGYEKALSAPPESKSPLLAEARKVLDIQLDSTSEASSSALKLKQLRSWLSLVENDLDGQRAANLPLKRNVFLVGANRSEIQANLETFSCEGTLTLLPGNYAARLAPGKRIWVAVNSDSSSTVQLSTAGSDVDTRLEVYSDHCPSPAQAPEQVQDDELGLSSRFELAPQRGGKRYIALVADQAGHAQINVALANGQISGQITLASNILNSTVDISVGRLDGNYFQVIGYGNLNGNSYSISVAPGNYYVSASPQYYNPTFLGQIYPNIPCAGRNNSEYCQYSLATLVAVADNQSISGINFSLTEGGVISGRIYGYVNKNQSSATVSAILPQPNNEATFTSNIDSVGRYRIAGLPPGNFKSQSRIPGFRDQLYNGINCPINNYCDLSLGTAINLSLNESRGNIDFTPQRMPTVSGRVTLSTPNAVYNNIYIHFYNDVGVINSTNTDSSGNYRATLNPGNYYVSFSENAHVPQLYQNKSCATNLGSGLCLNYNSGNVVSIAYGQNIEINAVLIAKGSVDGQIRDETGAIIEAATVIICPTYNPTACNNLYGSYSARTNAQGFYSILGVNSGAYYVLSTSVKHIDRAYPNIDCQIIPGQNCNVQLVGAQEIRIFDNQQTGGIDLVMPRAGAIKGKIVAPSQPYYFGSVETYKSGYVAGSYTNAVNYGIDGNYQIDDLVPGEYRIISGRQNAYNFPQIYSNRTCADSALFPCNVLNGDPIIVGQAGILTNRDFNLESRFTISGAITNTSGLSNSGVVLDLWESRIAPQLPVRLASIATNDSGRYAMSTPFFGPYNFFVATDAGPMFVNQIYAGVICAPNTSAYLGNCGFLGATSLAVPAVAPGQLSNVNFSLSVSSAFDDLFSSGFEARE